ncbi:TlpA family protein disulfide reductase [Clostridium gasigenes]|uniref:peroxiredoxin family protein n=1 Tax=Clostridium gasigenes TaxID=94869 RepID=UPI001C0E6610|nr:TlpA disulfide reductase family protein [Clostridium gasigenes]MBU3135444.1 TlpA family protein disulfide reductase [Clostridium gasigenes]
MKLKKSKIILLVLGIFLFIGGFKIYNIVINHKINNPFVDKKFENFKVKDIKGSEVTEDIFKDQKITMINIWRTDCKQIPDFQKLYDDNEDKGFNLIGIVADANSDKTKERAKEIIEKHGMKFTNIVPDENISVSNKSKFQIWKLNNREANEILSGEITIEFENFNPISIFVNSEGKILKECILGEVTIEDYQKAVNDILQKTN